MIYRPAPQPTAAAHAGGARRRARGRLARASTARARDHEAADGARPLARLRHPDRGPERVAAARRGAPGGHRVLDRRPRLDERAGGERACARSGRSSTTATRSRSARPRSRSAETLPDARVGRGPDRPARPEDLLPRAPLPLHLADRAQRVARRADAAGELHHGPAAGGRRRARPAGAGRSTRAARRGPEPGARRGRALRARREGAHASAAARRTTSGWTTTSSRRAHHARIEPRRDGVWVEDIGSTNGTYVNGTRLDAAAEAAPGDVVRIGETDLRYET